MEELKNLIEFLAELDDAEAEKVLANIEDFTEGDFTER